MHAPLSATPAAAAAAKQRQQQQRQQQQRAAAAANVGQKAFKGSYILTTNGTQGSQL